ncbi:hypothetical protein [Polaromonas sp. CG9_12]|nr:hypothetical protein [Polaromonas sp. CG9_12]
MIFVDEYLKLYIATSDRVTLFIGDIFYKLDKVLHIHFFAFKK